MYKTNAIEVASENAIIPFLCYTGTCTVSLISASPDPFGNLFKDPEQDPDGSHT